MLLGVGSDRRLCRSRPRTKHAVRDNNRFFGDLPYGTRHQTTRRETDPGWMASFKKGAPSTLTPTSAQPLPRFLRMVFLQISSLPFLSLVSLFYNSACPVCTAVTPKITPPSRMNFPGCCSRRPGEKNAEPRVLEWNYLDEIFPRPSSSLFIGCTWYQVIRAKYAS